ncbi:MAG: bifunctional DNA-binding transcriptional regulator/O6-methylguanine-DNA methyltransferase Ada [Kordiimonadaceae bacterium]|nr:bifunctional DNA-binding transcriptional regulator/O6-methylguanine-DNA methyltransferase Ada [Kordiimonadaceae bacterium]
MAKTVSKPEEKGVSVVDFQNEENRWQALKNNEKLADGHFYFAVSSTGIFCKPSCSARLPNRENVHFFNSIEETIKAGYKPCKRCRPTEKPLGERHATAVKQACRTIETSEKEPSLADLAKEAGMSPQYFNRIFKKVIGLTPKQYAIGLRHKTVQQDLGSANTVTEALYAAGYGSASRFYDGAKPRLGMAATKYRGGARNVPIRYAIKETWLGLVLVAATEKGVCAILFGDTHEQLLEDLSCRFSGAIIEASESGSDFEGWVETLLSQVEKPSAATHLPLDIQGTAFQERVWRALQTIPAGKTLSYSELASKIGKPGASRAVASACAANSLAIAIPCHRIIRADGGLSGYRWGVGRKKRLLDREKILEIQEKAKQ